MVFFGKKRQRTSFETDRKWWFSVSKNGHFDSYPIYNLESLLNPHTLKTSPRFETMWFLARSREMLHQESERSGGGTALSFLLFHSRFLFHMDAISTIKTLWIVRVRYKKERKKEGDLPRRPLWCVTWIARWIILETRCQTASVGCWWFLPSYWVPAGIQITRNVSFTTTLLFLKLQ